MMVYCQRVSLCDSPRETLQIPSAFALGRMSLRVYTVPCSFAMLEALNDVAYSNAIYPSLQNHIAHVSS
jgi:hypothetical protein